MTTQSREEAILRLARQRSLALVRKDIQTMQALLAAEFRYIKKGRNSADQGRVYR